ncbi:MAG: TolC family protein [Methylobacter sp.]|nr:TolC family protein [Methylobacter sp.]
MKNYGIHSLTAGWFCLLLGCTHYQSKPLTKQTVELQLETPTVQQLSVQATQIKHPLLKPVKFDMANGLSPDEAAILAVLRNPQLRAVRDQHAIASAQLLQAGLLPDPQVSYSFSAPSAGTNLGTNNAFGVGLSWQATALVWRQNQITAAGKQQQGVDLQIAWQEWQIAQGAKLAAYQLIVYSRQQGLLSEMAQRLEDNRARLQEAAELGLVTELERVAAVSAKNLVDIRLLALKLQIKQQQQRLNRAMGLKPHEAATLQQDIELVTAMNAPAYDALIQNIENRRLDLMALKRGYESQEERLHIAVMQQFPKISIGFDSARDNSNLYTMGFGVSMTVPVFDRNQGQIAFDRATRQQLFDQYTNRLFQARADIAELLVTIDPINKQIQSVRYAIPDLANLVKAYQSAIENGQVDVFNYYVAWTNLTDKKIDLLTLELQLVQAGIALEVASGLYHVAPDFNDKKL